MGFIFLLLIPVDNVLTQSNTTSDNPTPQVSNDSTAIDGDNTTDIVNNPLLILIIGLLGSGGVLGYLLKAFVDVRTLEVNRLNDLRKHVMETIEKMAPAYYRLSIYSSYLSYFLNYYLELKNKRQLLPIEETFSSELTELKYYTEYIAKIVLFNAAMFQRVITDKFVREGGSYFLADAWANDAIVDIQKKFLHNFTFDVDTVLKYVKSNTEQPEFLRMLKDSGEPMDLKIAYDNFYLWLINEHKKVKISSVYAQAYSDLLQQQMGRLYEDYYKRGFFNFSGGKIEHDYIKLLEKNQPSSLSFETYELIKKSSKDDAGEKKIKRSEILRVINDEFKGIDAETFTNLGWNYYASKKYDLAITQYERAMEIQPDAVIYNSLGNVYSSKCDFQKAANAFRQAVKLDKKNPVFQANIARMFYAQARNQSDHNIAAQYYNHAIMHYVEAIDLDFNDYHYHRELGQAYFNLGWYNESIKAYNHAIALKSTDSDLYSILANVYVEKNEPLMAEYSYKKAIEINPKVSEYHYRLGDLYSRLEKWKQAIYEYEQTLLFETFQSDYAVKIVDAFSNLEEQIGDSLYDKMIISCQNAIYANPNAAKNHYNLGIVYSEKRDYGNALYELDKAIALDPENADYYCMIGSVYFHYENLSMSITCYKKAVQINEEVGLYHKNLSKVYFRTGMYEKAIEELQLLSKTDPRDIEGLLLLSLTYAYTSKSGIVNKAYGLFQQAINLVEKRYKTHPLFYLIFGDLLFLNGYYHEGAKTFSKALDSNSYVNNDAQIKSLDSTLANISSIVYRMPYYKDILYKRIIVACQLAIKKDPKNADLYFHLGELYAKIDRYSEAEKYYRNASTLEQKNTTYQIHFHYALARSLYESGNYEEAVNHWTTVLDMASSRSANFRTFDIATVHTNLGAAYERLMRKSEARKSYEKASLFASDNLEIHFKLGGAYFRWGDIISALSEFQQAHRLNSKDARVYYMIGNCYYRLQDQEVAKEKWREAISCSTPSGKAFYNLGVLSYNRGDIENAEYYWQKSLQYDEKLPLAHYNLGVAYFRQGKRKAAIQSWQRCLAVSSDFIPPIDKIRIAEKHLDQKICTIIEE